MAKPRSIQTEPVKRMVRNLKKRTARRKKPIPQHPNPLRKFSIRQLKYRQNRLLGMSQYDAAIAAGYSHARARTCRVERVVKDSIIDELNRVGATNQEMAKHLLELAKDAAHYRSVPVIIEVDKNGDVVKAIKDQGVVKIPDNMCRKATWELIAKLKKQLTDQPIIDQSEHTHFTVVVHSTGANASDSQGRADSKTEFSVSTSDQPARS